MDFHIENKIQIMDSYIKYVESEINTHGIKPGVLDVEHLEKAKAVQRELRIRRKYPERFFDKYNTPVTIQFELTSKCNQACIMCYNQSGLSKNTENHDIDIDKLLNIAHELAAVNVPQIIISGGEPTLLGNDLFKIMDLFHEKGSHFVFITNGMLINEKNIKQFAKYNYAWMQFSIDGATSEIHDSIRGVKGAFKKVIHAVALARANGIPVGIASTIQRKNLHETSDMIDLAYHLGAYKHTLGEFMYAGRAVLNQDDISLDEKDIIQIRKTILKKRNQYAGLIQILKPFDPALALRIRMSTAASGLVIRPDGEVRIDCQAPARIGNVKDKNILDIWNEIGNRAWSHPKLLEYINKINNYKDLNLVFPRTHFDPDMDLTINS